MYVLSAIFRHLSDSDKGGLLSHLESLRRTIFGMAAVFAAAFVVCFCFTPQLMELLRRPADAVREASLAEVLPPDITPAAWEQALQLAQARAALPEDARPDFDRAAAKNEDASAWQTANLIPLLRAAAALPEGEARAAYLAAIPESEQKRVLLLLPGATQLLPSPDSRPLQLMGVFRPAESFLISVNTAFFAALVLSFPALLFLLLRFILPGLHPQERRLLRRALILGTLLFLAGCSFAYFAVLPRLLRFFFAYSAELGIANDWRISYYLSFAAKLVLLFGAVWELPVLLFPLIRLGILTPERMRSGRAYALLGCLFLALLLAPAPDPGTMLLLALPLYALYELTLFLASRRKESVKSRAGQGEASQIGT